MRRTPLPEDEPFTTATARKLGYDSKLLTRMVEQGVLRRPFMGVYLHREVDDSVEVRLQCLRLTVSPDLVVCDRTAAWVWGVDVFAYAEWDGPMPVECATPRFHRAIDRGGCDGHSRDLLPEDWATVHGVRVTTPLRTALDLGCNLYARDALAAMNALARAHGFGSAELHRVVGRFRRRRGVIQLRRLAPLVDPRVESQPESWIIEVLDACGFEQPQPQYWIMIDGVPTYRLDFAYPRAKIAIEYDGEEFHTDPEDRENDRVRRAWLRDHGWYVIVLTKDSFTPEAIDAWTAELRDVLAARTTPWKRF